MITPDTVALSLAGSVLAVIAMFLVFAIVYERGDGDE